MGGITLMAFRRRDPATGFIFGAVGGAIGGIIGYFGLTKFFRRFSVLNICRYENIYVNEIANHVIGKIISKVIQWYAESNLY